jgi:beta propeller repeat protein
MNSTQYILMGLFVLIAVPVAVLAAIPAYPSSPPATSGSGTEPGIPGIIAPLGLTPEWPAYPDVSGNLIVYQDNRSGYWDIFLYNLTAEQEVQLTNDDAPQQFPSISGDLIVWQEYRNGQWELVMYALNSTCPSWSRPAEACPSSQTGSSPPPAISQAIPSPGTPTVQPTTTTVTATTVTTNATPATTGTATQTPTPTPNAT